MTPLSPAPVTDTGAAFSLDASTGTITLAVSRDYAHFPHQYVFSVGATEQYTQLSTNVTVSALQMHCNRKCISVENSVYAKWLTP